jgi:hypothetical protein
MNLFRKQKELNFDEKKVIVKEITPLTLIKLANNEYTNEKILLDHTNLTEDEIENLSVEAFNFIFTEFQKLNEKHFSNNDESEELDEGKS